MPHDVEIPESRWVPYDVHLLELAAVEEERDRARSLAAKLEEVVAMRTAIVKAVADRNPDSRPDEMIAVQAWARAQLSEIP